jgi:hypothetical protein
MSWFLEAEEALREVESRTNWFVHMRVVSAVPHPCWLFQRFYCVTSDRALELVHELELGQDEDAPMSMEAHLEVGSVPVDHLFLIEKIEHSDETSHMRYQ